MIGRQDLRSIPIDAFRGVTIALMLLVNNPGGSVYYPFLQHAAWNGWTPADLVFPLFLFIAGVTIPLSLGGRLARGYSRRNVLLLVLRRTSILFALGLFMNGFPHFDLQTLRIMGVLQRIALCFLFASLVFLSLGLKGWLATIAVLLFGYWALLAFVPVPGYSAGVLTQEANLVKYVDNLILGSHIYRWMGGFEPEGILSTIPSVATALLGVLTGQHLRANRSPSRDVSRLLAPGAICILISLLWDRWLPINKNLWTSSYVLFTGGAAIVSLETCHYLIDVRKFTGWSMPFTILGMNSIAIYVLSGIADLSLSNSILTLADGGNMSAKAFIYESCFASWAGPLNGSLLYALACLAFWFGMAALLHRRGIFIKI